jgi:hypothetical protein
MMQSEFGSAIMAALADEAKTQTWLAATSGLTQSALNHLINRGYRPKRENLGPICQAFARPDGLDVLCGHLRDEIAAAGYRRTEIVLSTHPAETDHKLDRALDELRAIAGQRRDVAQLLFDLASLCEELPSHHELTAQHQERLLAADPAGPGEQAPAPGKPIKYPCTKSAKKAKD